MFEQAYQMILMPLKFENHSGLRNLHRGSLGPVEVAVWQFYLHPLLTAELTKQG